MKTTVRHETEKDFFARMTSLAQKLDRGEQVEAYENVSFEDLDDMNTFKAEQEQKPKKSPLKLILGGGNKRKAGMKTLTFGTMRHELSKKAVWISASDTFNADARVMRRNYRNMFVFTLDNGVFSVEEKPSKTEKRRIKQNEK